MQWTEIDGQHLLHLGVPFDYRSYTVEPDAQLYVVDHGTVVHRVEPGFDNVAKAKEFAEHLARRLTAPEPDRGRWFTGNQPGGDWYLKPRED